MRRPPVVAAHRIVSHGSDPRPLDRVALRAHELQTATPWRRRGGALIDIAVATVTVGIGWFIWFAVVAPRGQTPGKTLLGMYVMRSDGTRGGGGYTWLREFVVKHLLVSGGFALLGLLTIGLAEILWVVPAAWCIWDTNRRTGWDWIAGSYVGYAPTGLRPLTAAGRDFLGRRP